MTNKPEHTALLEKLCPRCGVEKNINEFHKSSRAKSGAQTYCKVCHYKIQLNHRNKNPEVRKAVERKSREKHIDVNIWRWIKCRADKKKIPVCKKDDFKKWYNSQKKVCVYCEITEIEAKKQFKRRLSIDQVTAGNGYLIGNIVLACQRCNLVKNKYLTFEQMREIAQKYFIKARGEA